MLKKIIFIQSITIIILACLLYYQIKLNQNSQISLPIVSEKITNNSAKQTKKILVIGNSITLNKTYEHWWGYWGMAASSRDKDYVHVLANKIAQNYNVKLDIMNFYHWELNDKDRNQILDMLNKALDKKPDYIVIQLGDNIVKPQGQNLDTDYDLLVKYIKSRTNNSQIIIVGNFWRNHTVDKAKHRVCINNQIRCVYLNRIQDDKYKAAMGSIVKGDDNKEHRIDYISVSNHPNDEAMNYIANKIYFSLY